LVKAVRKLQVEQGVLQVEVRDRNIQVEMELQVQTMIPVAVEEDGMAVAVEEMTQAERTEAVEAVDRLTFRFSIPIIPFSIVKAQELQEERESTERFNVQAEMDSVSFKPREFQDFITGKVQDFSDACTCKNVVTT
jgi:hypothetical protein